MQNLQEFCETKQYDFTAIERFSDYENFTIDFSGPEWKVSEIKNIRICRKGLMINDIVHNVDDVDVNENLAECRQKIESKQDGMKFIMNVI